MSDEKKDGKDEDSGNDEKFVKGRAYWDKELDLPCVEIKLHRKARQMLSDFCVKTGSQHYSDGRNNKIRYLVKRVVTTKGYDVSGQYGCFFDKKAIDDDEKVRLLYFASYPEARSFSESLKKFFESMVEGSLEINKEYNFVIYMKEPGQVEPKAGA